MNKHAQAGVTLISLLVGLVIAMICIIAVLTTYRVVVKTGTESRIAANHDTQLQMGLTNAQMLLQNAGFGLDGTTHLVTSVNITAQVNSASQTISNAVLWRFQGNNGVTCQGLADIKNADNTQRQLVLLSGITTGSTLCDSTTNLTALTWQVQSSLANLRDYSSDQSNPAQITWQKTTAACTPYGAGKIDGSIQHTVISISSKTSTQQSANLSPVEVSVCLVNISA